MDLERRGFGYLCKSGVKMNFLVGQWLPSVRWEDTVRNYKLGFKLIEFLIWALSWLLDVGRISVSLVWTSWHRSVSLSTGSGTQVIFFCSTCWVGAWKDLMRTVTNKIVKTLYSCLLEFFWTPKWLSWACEHFCSHSSCELPGLTNRSQQILLLHVLSTRGPDSIYILNTQSILNIFVAAQMRVGLSSAAASKAILLQGRLVSDRPMFFEQDRTKYWISILSLQVFILFSLPFAVVLLCIITK